MGKFPVDKGEQSALKKGSNKRLIVRDETMKLSVRKDGRYWISELTITTDGVERHEIYEALKAYKRPYDMA